MLVVSLAPAAVSAQNAVCDGLPAEARCTTIEVPEDHADPDSRRLALRVVVMPARTGDARPDPVFLLSGGPGQAATAFARFMAGRDGAMAERDVVLVDQRGTGASNPLACTPPADGVPASFDGILSSDAFLAACLEEVRERADPRLYTTTQSAHDLDVVRTALGYGPVNVTGSSYGTRLALEYARRYPDAVRTVTIQGVAPVDFRSPLLYARYAQNALDRLFDDCRSDARCAADFPGLEGAWSELLARLRASPDTVSVEVGQRTWRVVYDGDDLAYTVRTMLYGPQALALPDLIDRAWRGDTAPLASAYANRAAALWPQLAQGLHLSVFCAEDLPFFDDADVAEATAGTYLGTYAVDEYRRGCRVWPRGDVPADFHDPVTVDVPVLILSGRRDPSTPPATGEWVRAHLPDAVHLVHPWGGHGWSGAVDDACPDGLGERFLRTGSTEGLDASCMDRMAPAPFRPRTRAGENPSTPPAASTVPRVEVPTLTELAAAPSGRHLAYVRVDLGGETPTQQVFVTARDGWPGAAVGSGALVAFRPDGEAVSWLAPGEAGTVVRVADLDGTPRAVVVADGGVVDYAWAPDGARMAVAARGPDRRVGLSVHDLAGGTVRPVATGDGHVHVEAFGTGGAFAWSPDGRHLAFALQADPSVEGIYGTDLYVADVDAGTVRAVVRRPGMDARPAWSPDGTRIAFSTSFETQNRFGRHGLAVVDVADGTVTDLGVLDETFLEAPAGHRWLDEGSLATVRADGVSTHLVRLDASPEAAGAPRPGGPSSAAGALPGDDGPRRLGPDGPGTAALPALAGLEVVYLWSTPDTPWEVRAVDPATGRDRRVGGVDATASPTRWTVVGWTGPDGGAREGVLLRPASDAPAPLLVWLHGGPDGRATAAYDPSVPFPTPSFDPLPVDGLLDAGFAVLLPNHRASAGYPARERTSVAGRYPGVLEDDVLAAVDHLVRTGQADPERLYLGGFASGGMAATMLLTRTSRFRAAVSGATNTDLLEAWADGDFAVQWRSLMGAPPADAPETWAEASPLANAHRITTPLLVLHGTDDPLVPVAHSRRLVDRIRDAGGQAELVLLEGVGHGVVLPRDRRTAGAHIVDWLTAPRRDRPGTGPGTPPGGSG